MRPAVLAALLAVLLLPAAAPAATLLPPNGKALLGVAGGGEVGDFAQRAGRRPAVWQFFIQWDDSIEYVFRKAEAEGARVMLHLSTARAQNMPGRYTPQQIARGRADAYLLFLNRRIAEHGGPTYVRLMGEMNNCDLAYASHDCAGRPRGAQHSPATFKQAWRRAAIILRGGSLARVDAQLRALRLPRVQGADGDLEKPRVAMMFTPMTGGSPEIAALRPQVFWPGGRWVDWIGTSFYSKYPNFGRLEAYYSWAMQQRKPFALAEWALWADRDDPGFVSRFFDGFARARPGVRMVVYNQGQNPSGPFRLRRYPKAAAVLRGRLDAPRWGGR